PTSYLKNLSQFKLLVRYIGPWSPQTAEVRLRRYHALQAEALKKNQAAALLVENRSPPLHISKMAIERPVEMVLASAVKGQAPNKSAAQESASENFKLDSAEELANWKLLDEDTRINESTRRQQIHEMLAG